MKRQSKDESGPEWTAMSTLVESGVLLAMVHQIEIIWMPLHCVKKYFFAIDYPDNGWLNVQSEGQ